MAVTCDIMTEHHDPKCYQAPSAFPWHNNPVCHQAGDTVALSEDGSLAIRDTGRKGGAKSRGRDVGSVGQEEWLNS